MGATAMTGDPRPSTGPVTTPAGSGENAAAARVHRRDGANRPAVRSSFPTDPVSS